MAYSAIPPFCAFSHLPAQLHASQGPHDLPSAVSRSLKSVFQSFLLHPTPRIFIMVRSRERLLRSEWGCHFCADEDFLLPPLLCFDRWNSIYYVVTEITQEWVPRRWERHRRNKVVAIFFRLLSAMHDLPRSESAKSNSFQITVSCRTWLRCFQR